MNMISELRQRVRQQGTATITAEEYDRLQAEWITRVGAQDLFHGFASKLDICKRLAEMEGADGDYAMLANDYGGTGYDQDPAVLAVGKLQVKAVALHKALEQITRGYVNLIKAIDEHDVNDPETLFEVVEARAALVWHTVETAPEARAGGA